MPNIIIKGKTKLGRTRSEQEKNLRKEGWGVSLSNEQLDKSKFLERKFKDATGSKDNFLNQAAIDKLK